MKTMEFSSYYLPNGDYNDQHQNTFKINTKNTCFLCLRDIFAHTWIVDEDRCRVEIKTENNHHDQIIFDLAPILRLVNLPCHKLAKTINEPADGQNIDSFSVSLCTECANIATTLTDLFSDLELIRMKFLGKLTQFTDIINHSQMDKERLQLFRSSLSSPKSYKIAETIRNQVKNKGE